MSLIACRSPGPRCPTGAPLPSGRCGGLGRLLIQTAPFAGLDSQARGTADRRCARHPEVGTAPDRLAFALAAVDDVESSQPVANAAARARGPEH